MSILGFPNGSLAKRTRELLHSVGISIPIEGRKYRFEIVSKVFSEVIILRPQDMPEAVSCGMVTAGFSGMDWLTESELENDLGVVATLPYSKGRIEAPQVVVLGKTNDFQDTPETVVATEYLKLSQQRFHEAKIVMVHGTAEAWVVGDKADYCVDLYDQGETAKANNLVVVGEPIICAPVVLLARKDCKVIDELKAFGQKLEKVLNSLRNAD